MLQTQDCLKIIHSYPHPLVALDSATVHDLEENDTACLHQVLDVV